MNRRTFMAQSTTAAGACALGVGQSVAAESQEPLPSGARAGNPIAVSTYSFWRFREDSKATMEECIQMAGEMGFDAIELLEIQMHRKDNAYLQSLKRQALVAGLALCGLSTHQTFVSPDAEKRKGQRAADQAKHRAGLRAGHTYRASEHGSLGHEQGF